MKSIQETNSRVENIGTTGRILRVAVGVALLLPLFFVSGPVGGLAFLALLAILPVICGIDGYCPLTAWYQNAIRSKTHGMSTSHRISYAALAIALIGSVFVMQGHSLGTWAILPLLGIYPAIVAIFGNELIGELLGTANQDVKTPGKVVNLKRSQQQDNSGHGNVGHAA